MQRKPVARFKIALENNTFNTKFMWTHNTLDDAALCWFSEAVNNNVLLTTNTVGFWRPGRRRSEAAKYLASGWWMTMPLPSLT